MSRRRRATKRVISPDSKYNSVLLARFINVIMRSGERSIAEKIVYGALSKAESRLGESAMSIFSAALNNVMPQMEVRSRRIGGVTYQVPVEVKEDRAVSLALRWIFKAAAAARKRSNKMYMDCLCNELLEAYNKRGGAYKMREEKYKMAEANKAFSHFRFN
ncbi:ribosomal protein S7 [Ehrlichia chaffeensis str. Heartland]|uniref:Small ribosomal subunit protein uS7 n=1 Tax=Ehrlichia chaffeensis (strain ATCC CRL-10679 / Arkansas) TaxID=205920 RepID=RS7_EHRCR|nr:30S ribosomal protein S7 [Ehrlichia chaffeensis]Q2GFN4.1 RecName: Full=Small ribosomal subunit protein uS7; AltName: Full=30S ribosomal protein S7 [Ehrlichia chaffeensis str. Arkansas]ABD45424.1 ribosomal protein S7 [Ehrlichia chaffeensis str. Arkansas]AHX03981.1 ribosomal protein S7 [Ehrlichia chaffeensis str. Heartland]AHX05286.1 ribosomal protein S7 [Ehrlichia chaffeensis str. Jax]AHX06274.1 ribosomal protein S7 [Ehrlichia chaffeensis str. Liberty]AHX07526.1 ribosomal protein S7 [Ehrlic